MNHVRGTAVQVLNIILSRPNNYLIISCKTNKTNVLHVI